MYPDGPACRLSFVIGICLFAVCSGQSAQGPVDYLASNLRLEYKVLDNTPVGEQNNQWSGHMSLTNVGADSVTDSTWVIYFCSIRLFEKDTLLPSADNSVELGDSGIEVYHVDGCLHKLVPLPTFQGFHPNYRIELPFTASDWSVARTDAMPKWYVASTDPSTEPRTITSTVSESLDFVADFTTEEQWKRRDSDLYNPFTPEQRFEETGVEDSGGAVKPVIPTVVSYTEHLDHVRIDTGDWVVVYTGADVKHEADYLADKLNTVALSEAPSSRYIELDIDEGNVDPATHAEAYRLEVLVDEEKATITGNAAAGVFYGIQSFLSLAAEDATISGCVIMDHPRFPFRGMHVDVSRNFHTKEDMLKLLDVMSMYKLNKFHFHVTDDEGWRLEIPGIPELTQTGARRCHDLEETTCLLPQLGSGPSNTTSGSGYYSVQEYQQILQFAHDRHIEVIPEFDMPGHGHAAIRAMEARAASGQADYLLSDPNDASEYFSVQMYRHNAINPCLQTTYAFVEKVMDEIISMHQNIQPLRYFNFGGDETPGGAWEGSPLCAQYTTDNNIELSRDALKEWFVKEISVMADGKGLQFGGWEDGLMEGTQPYNRSQFPNEEVVGWAWNNIWEWGSGNRAYQLANAGYQVVIAHATHLYFDHPHEPDPEERGFYWATRYTDAEQTFGYMPDDVYKNIDVSNFGHSLEGYCDTNVCVPLDEDKRHNVLGMQGHLWSETVRTSQQLDEMIYPRIVALAERAWHRADWEALEDFEAPRSEDWHDFANTVGYKELRRLDARGVSYSIPPPGARFNEDGTLEASTMYPGLTIQYSIDGGDHWCDYSDSAQVPFESNTDVTLVTRSADRSRTSRAITLQSPQLPVDPDVYSAGNVNTLTLAANIISIIFIVLIN